MDLIKTINAINVKFNLTTTNYSLMCLIRNIVCESKNFTLLGTEHHMLSYYSKEAEKYKDDISAFITNSEKWSTYDGCSITALYTRKNKIIVAVSIWEGDSMYGKPTSLRFKVETEVSPEFVELYFSELIDFYIEELATLQYQKEQETRKIREIKNIKNKILEEYQ
jgi:hypothetical protein